MMNVLNWGAACACANGSTVSPLDMLLCCSPSDAFAIALHNVTGCGFEYAEYEDDYNRCHAYGVRTGSDGRKIYMDVRGSTDDLSELLMQFEPVLNPDDPNCREVSGEAVEHFAEGSFDGAKAVMNAVPAGEEYIRRHIAWYKD